MAYADVILADTPFAYYKLEEGNSGVGVTFPIADASGNSHPAALMVGSGDTQGTTQSGKINNGYKLPYFGSGFLGMPCQTSTNNPTVWSMELWFKTTHSCALFWFTATNESWGGGGSYDRNLSVQTTGNLRFGEYTGSPNNLTTTGVNVLDGNWHHAVVTRNSTTRTIYLDGAQVATDTPGAAAADYIGYWRFGSISATWDGTSLPDNADVYDECAIYTTALSSTRVAAHYTAAGSLTYKQECLADSPAGLWMLDETTGTQATDSSPNTRHGTYTGTHTKNAGTIFGLQAVDLNAAGYIDVPDNAAFSTHAGASGQITIEMLVKPDSLGGEYFLGKGSGAGYEFAVTWDGAGAAHVYMWVLSGSSNVVETTTDGIAFAVGQETHFAFTYNRATPSVHIYVNGVDMLLNPSSPTFSGTTSDGGANLHLGKRTDLSAQYDGKIAGVAIYPTALSGARIAAHYAALTAPAGSPPGQVTGLSAARTSTNTATLTWTAPADGGSAITGYKIERAPDAAGTPGTWGTVTATTGTTTVSYADTTATAGVKYWYRVSAINSVGTGTASTAASVSMPFLVAGDTLKFRILRNGVVTGMTYTQVPSITIGTGSGATLTQTPADTLGLTDAATVTLSGVSSPFNDNFNRADGALGSPWVVVPKPTTGDYPMPVISGNTAVSVGAATEQVARLSGTFGPIQLLAVTAHLGADYSESGALAHLHTGASGLFGIYCTDGLPEEFPPIGNIDGPSYQLYYADGTDYHLISNVSAPNATATRRILLAALASNQLELWADGIRVLTGTDSGVVPRTGPPGFTHFGLTTTPTTDDYHAEWYSSMQAAPTITSFAPGTINPGTVVTVTGTGFVTDATMVTISGTDIAVTVTSPTSGTFIAPSGLGTNTVTLRTPFGTDTEPITITEPGPAVGAIVEFSPAVGDHTSQTFNAPPGVTGAATEETFVFIMGGYLDSANRTPSISGFTLVGSVTYSSDLSGFGLWVAMAWFRANTNLTGVSTYTVNWTGGNLYMTKAIAGRVTNTSGFGATATGVPLTFPGAIPQVTANTGDLSFTLAMMDGGGSLSTPSPWTTATVSGTDLISHTEGFLIATSTGLTPAGVFGRTGADNAGIAASATFAKVTAGTSLTQTPADNLGLTDAVTLTFNRVLTPADTLGLLDAGAVVSAENVAAGDNLGLTDAATVVINRVQALADTLGLTDAATPVLAQVRAPADLLGLTDAASVVLSLVLTPADTLGITDSATVTAAGVVNQAPADTLGLSDAVTLIFSRVIAPADTLGLTDSATIAAAGIINQAPADTLALTDSATVVRAYVNTPADTLALSDAVTLSIVRAFADSLGLLDAVTIALNLVLTPADNLGLTDSATVIAAGIVNQAPTDTLGLTDAVTLVSNRVTPVPDTLGLTDVAAVVVSRTAAGADTLGLTDAVTVVLNLQRSPADTLGLVDAALTSVAGVGVQSPADSLGITDAVTLTFNWVITRTDTLGLTDTPTVFNDPPRTGSAVATHDWTIVAQGTAPTLGVKQGTAVATYTWTQTAQGTSTPVVVDHIWTLLAEGRKPSRSLTVVAAHRWASTAVGRKPSQSQPVANFHFTAVAYGLSGSVGQVGGKWNGSDTVSMQYGDKEVIEWLLIPS